MHLKTALFGLNFDAFEYSWDETGGATRIGLALLLYVYHVCYLQYNKLKQYGKDMAYRVKDMDPFCLVFFSVLVVITSINIHI